MFEPVEGKNRYVMDRDTGAVMFIKGTPEIDTETVFFQSPHVPELRFSVRLVRKHP